MLRPILPQAIRSINAWEVLSGAVVVASLSLQFPDRLDLYFLHSNTDLNSPSSKT